jgi:hypothetical protein
MLRLQLDFYQVSLVLRRKTSLQTPLRPLRLL